MSLFLCIDCGGTKTAVVIADKAGNVVGRGRGGPSNITYLSTENFISSITQAVVQALKEAAPTNISLHSLPFASGIASPFAAAWLGISGADSQAAIDKVTPAVSELTGVPVGPDLVIANDSILLAAPVHIYPDVSNAIAVIGGTGSNTVSFKAVDGRIEQVGRVGGWGWILGDEGGGYDVGRETIRQILAEEDKASVVGSPSRPSKLRDSVLKQFGVGSVYEIFGTVYHSDPSASSSSTEAFAEGDLRRLNREKRISSLPPSVFEAAFDQDDWLAKQILEACAGHLASHIAILLGEGLTDASNALKAEETVISFGGSLVANPKYRQLILDNLAKRGYTFPRTHYVEEAAVTGAVALAASRAAK